MKIKNALLWAFTLSFFIALPAHAGHFSDVLDNAPNATAINYLTDVGVVQGYPDQTFRPTQQVNRVEFLKLVLESSDVDTDTQKPTPFPDVDESAWYGQYVRKAYAEGWIEGYPDGTFKPEQTINKVEALKIIGEVQQWELPESVEEAPFDDVEPGQWFTPYVAYAKAKNYLEERTVIYLPDWPLSRGQISELIFRSYITRNSGSDEFSLNLANRYPPSEFVGTGETEPISVTSPPPENTETETVEFSPYPFEMHETDTFEGIDLDAAFPNTFYVNEVYYLDGAVTSGSPSQVFVFLAPEGNNNSNDYSNYVSDVETKQFSIPIIFREPGNFKMGIIRGNAGESKVVEISVLPELPSMPSTVNNKTPTALNVTYENFHTTFSWNDSGSELIKLHIFQDNASKTYYFRQGREGFSVDYNDFLNFEETTTHFTVQAATLSNDAPLELKSTWSDSFKQSFEAVEHQYSEIFDAFISVNSLPEKFETVQPIQFTGTTNAEIFLEAAVIKPDGFVDLFDLSSSSQLGSYFGSATIPDGGSFTFSYQPTTPGTYILEINGIDGSAVLNTSIYVANGIPLLPGFFDLNLYAQPEPITNLQDARNQLLQLINQERQAVGLASVSLDSELSKLAQAHSDDMVARDFFGHINPDGQSPDDRRIARGIPMPVGENLAISPTIPYTHHGLMQSAIHRNNILDPDWTKVGIGLATDASGSIYTTQEFSSETYTEAQLDIIEQNILAAMNARRANAGLSALQTGSDVEFIANEWSTKMAEQSFFDFESPDGETLSGLVTAHAPGKPVQALILESSSSKKLEDEAIQSNEVTNNMWTKVGIGVKNDATGKLKTTVLFTTN